MTQPMLWSTFWVDSIDRHDWMVRVQEALDIPGVDKIQADRRSGQVRVRHNPDIVTSFQINSHIRAAGL